MKKTSNDFNYFCFGGFVCALLTLVLMLQDLQYVSWRLLPWPMAGMLAAFFLPLAKGVSEKAIYWRGIFLSVIGAVTVFLALLLGLLLNKAQFGW